MSGKEINALYELAQHHKSFITYQLNKERRRERIKRNRKDKVSSC